MGGQQNFQQEFVRQLRSIGEGILCLREQYEAGFKQSSQTDDGPGRSAVLFNGFKGEDSHEKGKSDKQNYSIPGRSDVPFNVFEGESFHAKDNSDRKNHSSRFVDANEEIILSDRPESTSGNAGFISEQSTINYINQRKNEQSTAFSMENHNESARVRSMDDGHYPTSEREALEGYCDAIDGVQNARSYPMGSHSNNDYGNSRVIRNDSNFGTKGRESHQARPIPSGQMSVQ